MASNCNIRRKEVLFPTCNRYHGTEFESPSKTRRQISTVEDKNDHDGVDKSEELKGDKVFWSGCTQIQHYLVVTNFVSVFP